MRKAKTVCSGLPWWLRRYSERLPTTQETWVQSLGREDLPEKEMATHSRKIPWTEKPGRLQPRGLQNVRHD